MSLDTDGDGQVTLAEYETAVDQLLARLDQDGNGVVSEAEARAWQVEGTNRFRAHREAEEAELVRLADQAALQPLELSAKPTHPDLPGIAAGARLIRVSANKGAGLSTVSVGDDDVVVGVSVLDIEPGPEPLVIVASSRAPMIWQLTGAVERIRMFVGKGVAEGEVEPAPHVGVTGLPRDRVAIPKFQGCSPGGIGGDGPISSDDLVDLLDRRPERALDQSGHAMMGVPSGVGRTNATLLKSRKLPTTGAAATLWLEMQHTWPAGVIEIAAEQVVAALPVQRYRVLPQHAGLAQLIEEGALTVTGLRRVRRSRDGATFYGETNLGGTPLSEEYLLPSNFRIERQIRFPADLRSAADPSFTLGEGVPMPEGNMGEALVGNEETGLVMKGR